MASKLDSAEVTVEAAIGKKSLEQAIRRQLQPLWHQLVKKFSVRVCFSRFPEPNLFKSLVFQKHVRP